MSRSSSRFSTALLASTALSFVPVGPGHAQQERPVIEEIAVTATRREKSVYATPINITAVSTSAIEKQGIADIADLARFVPGLTLVDQGARGSSQLIVRGLSVQTASGSEALGFGETAVVQVALGRALQLGKIRIGRNRAWTIHAVVL